MNHPSLSAFRPQLEWVTGPLSGQSTELPLDFNIVGSEPAHSHILVAERSVSPRHATLEISGGGVTLVDLASAAGTFVNGVPVTRRELQDGDRVSFGADGGACFVFRTSPVATAALPAPAAAAAPPPPGTPEAATDTLSPAEEPAGQPETSPGPRPDEPGPVEAEEPVVFDDFIAAEADDEAPDDSFEAPPSDPVSPAPDRLHRPEPPEPAPAAAAPLPSHFNADTVSSMSSMQPQTAGQTTPDPSHACADCGTTLNPGARFCMACGKSVEGPRPQAAEPPPPAVAARGGATKPARERRNGRGADAAPQPDLLPSKMRHIIRGLSGLMDDYNQTLAALDKERSDARAAADKALEAAKREFEKGRGDNDARLKTNENEAGAVKRALETKKETAEKHVRQHGVTPDVELNLLSDSSAPNPNGLVEAKKLFADIDQSLNSLLRTQKPKNLGGMVGGFVAAGFVISLCAASAAGGNGTAAFVGVNVLATGIGVAIAAMRYQFATSEMRNWYRALANNLSRAFEAADGFHKGAKVHHANVESDLQGRYRKAHEAHARAVSAAESTYGSKRAEFEKTVAAKVADSRQLCEAFYAETGFGGLRWDEPGWGGWDASASPLLSCCVGTLRSPQFGFEVPAMLSFNGEEGGRCLLLNATGAQKERATLAVQSVMLRLLANVPPGRVLFTLIDPVGLGQNVAPFMPLADFEEKLITSRAWTEPRHIEEQLSKLTEHMENVIQKYLRSDYASIEEYNASAGEVAEPYRVLVVLDFPVNFSDSAARRLVSIARNGPRCGVYTVIVRDTAKKEPHGFSFADLEHSANLVECGAPGQPADAAAWRDADFERYALGLDEPPKGELFKEVIRAVGERSKDAMRVEVPFDRLLEMAGVTEATHWELEAADRLCVPLGPSGAKKLQYLTLGRGTEHHAVVIGMPGSGKSNLMHIIVTSMALMYPPSEVQLYLIDFKQGVEFKRYAESRLPHARVIAIESEREFGLSVLKGLGEELYRRGEAFRKSGVNAIGDYRRNFPDERLPRILLLVDEFQEFFSYDDQIAREAGLLLDRLIRQGRYAGIHVMLGSQSLGNRSSLPSSTLGQVGIRIALKCSESDARQIMADDNPQARLLSRPGEAIYNAASGLIEGNNFFQVALFTEEDRQARLDEIGALAARVAAAGGGPFEPPIIFEGNEPSRLEGCAPLKELLARPGYAAAAKSKELWLGEPVAIRPPTSARLRRQGASNLLVVTRNEEEGVGMMASAILSLAAQAGPEEARFLIIDMATADSPWSDLSEEIADLLPHRAEVLGRRDLPGALKELVAEVDRRIAGEGKEAGEDIYLFIQGLHRARDLRDEDGGGRGSSIFDRGAGKEPGAPELFARLLREGPENGVHVVAWCDAYSNVKRTLGRAVNEFALRVAGAMSNDDSMGLIDDSSASKLEKPHRAIFFDDERPGHLEKFRPYAIPERDWLEQAGRALRARAGTHQAPTGD